MLDVFDASSVGLAFVDREFRFVRINPALASANDQTVAEHIGRTVEEVVPDIWPQLKPRYLRVIDHAETIANVEAEGLTATDPGRTHHWLTSLYPVIVDGTVVGVGNVTVDVTDRKELERDLHDQALRGALTGLPNRALLTEAGAGLLERARGTSLLTTVLFIDLDNFKAITCSATVRAITCSATVRAIACSAQLLAG